MNHYETPDMKIVYFEAEDVLTTSVPGNVTDPDELPFD